MNSTAQQIYIHIYFVVNRIQYVRDSDVTSASSVMLELLNIAASSSLDLLSFARITLNSIAARSGVEEGGEGRGRLEGG